MGSRCLTIVKTRCTFVTGLFGRLTCRPIKYPKKMSDEFPALEGEVSMQVPAGEGEAVPEEAAAPEPAAVAPVVEMRKKKPCALYWKRPKSHLYEYNYGYGENYYKGMIDYLDERSNGFKPSPPKPLNWAERALKSYTEKREAAARSNAINPDVNCCTKFATTSILTQCTPRPTPANTRRSHHSCCECINDKTNKIRQQTDQMHHKTKQVQLLS